jgi:hypothetical protein
MINGLCVANCVVGRVRVRRAFIFSIAVSTFVVWRWIAVGPGWDECEDQGFAVDEEDGPGVVEEDQDRSRDNGGARGVRREMDSMDVCRSEESSRFRSTMYLAQVDC